MPVTVKTFATSGEAAAALSSDRGARYLGGGTLVMRALNEGDAFTFMSPDEISMVRTIERVIGQPIPRISMPGFDFGNPAAEESVG